MSFLRGEKCSKTNFLIVMTDFGLKLFTIWVDASRESQVLGAFLCGRIPCVHLLRNAAKVLKSIVGRASVYMVNHIPLRELLSANSPNDTVELVGNLDAIEFERDRHMPSRLGPPTLPSSVPGIPFSHSYVVHEMGQRSLLPKNFPSFREVIEAFLKELDGGKLIDNKPARGHNLGISNAHFGSISEVAVEAGKDCVPCWPRFF